ncbi:MAG: hypothetical protein ABSC25_22295 [Roseiarcus sp.]|jgi:predicted S18 family serine protease
MKKLALAAVACCALATPAFAAGSNNVTVNVKLTNVAMVSQGGKSGSGDQANVAIVTQGAIAIVQAPKSAPIVDLHNFGSIPLP